MGQISNDSESNMISLNSSINMTSDLTLYGMYLDASIASKPVNLNFMFMLDLFKTYLKKIRRLFSTSVREGDDLPATLGERC